MTNDPTKSSYEITIKADVIPTLEVTPRSLSFGKIPLGAGAKRTLILQSGNPNYTLDAMNFFGEIKDQLTYSLEETSPPGSKTRKWKLEVASEAGDGMGLVHPEAFASQAGSRRGANGKIDSKHRDRRDECKRTRRPDCE